MSWTHDEAVLMAVRIEQIAPNFDCHVALTGGTLYKCGPRKDADFLFYRVRQADRINMEGLLKALSEIGIDVYQDSGWVLKARHEQGDIDLFFPERPITEYPDELEEAYFR